MHLHILLLKCLLSLFEGLVLEYDGQILHREAGQGSSSILNSDAISHLRVACHVLSFMDIL